MTNIPPLSLYIHVPWCVRKCPYCDFNSHEAAVIPEASYVRALLADIEQDAHLAQGREIQTVFIGGGTPSLFSAAAYAEIFSGVSRFLTIAEQCEITLEANPGTVEQEKFNGYRVAGINRLSIGVQSFDAQKLKKLGRIHGGDEAIKAAEAAHNAGFDNFNIDLMHGLPEQTVAQAMADLQQAVALRPTHLSWYQLTIEPNTVFYRDAPVLPQDDTLWDIQEAGQQFLAATGYAQYEVSAYAQAGRECLHNKNYWEFGDYLAVGAGAHGKVTQANGVHRYAKTRLPRDYLAAHQPEKNTQREDGGKNSFTASAQIISPEEVVFEFMLNALRLREGVPADLFTRRTGLALSHIGGQLNALRARELLVRDESRLQCTAMGFNYLNQVLKEFLA